MVEHELVCEGTWCVHFQPALLSAGEEAHEEFQGEILLHQRDKNILEGEFILLCSIVWAAMQ